MLSSKLGSTAAPGKFRGADSTACPAAIRRQAGWAGAEHEQAMLMDLRTKGMDLNDE
jgi:hypothetical protein